MCVCEYSSKVRDQPKVTQPGFNQATAGLDSPNLSPDSSLENMAASLSVGRALN